jgi:hypothetical protein
MVMLYRHLNVVKSKITQYYSITVQYEETEFWIGNYLLQIRIRLVQSFYLAPYKNFSAAVPVLMM